MVLIGKNILHVVPMPFVFKPIRKSVLSEKSKSKTESKSKSMGRATLSNP